MTESPKSSAGATRGPISRTAPARPPIQFFAANVPPFPVQALHGWIGDAVTALSRALALPADIPALLALSALATAVQRLVRVCVRPGWSEQTNVYTVGVAESGERKSAAVDYLATPIQKHEESLRSAVAADIPRIESDLAILKLRLLRLRKTASRAFGDEAATLSREAAEVSAQIAAMPQPTLPVLLADDVTPERLGTLMAENGGAMAVLSPEGDLLELVAGRYGGTANCGVLLRAYTGDPLKSQRITRGPVDVLSPTMAIGLAVQPTVIDNLGRTPEFRGKGVLARFLYAWPASQVGYRPVDLPPVPDKVTQAYQEGMTRLLSLSEARGRDRANERFELGFAPDAYRQLLEFAAVLEPRMRPDGELAHLRDWANKLPGGVARIAGLLHMARHSDDEEPWKMPIDLATTEDAIAIAWYLVPHAQVALAAVGMHPDVLSARIILDWISRRHAATFSKRDLFEGVKGRFQRVKAMIPAINLLVEHGYIREVQPEEADSSSRRPGRPAGERYEVSPYVLKASCGGPEDEV
jgi:hypothetical protein